MIRYTTDMVTFEEIPTEVTLSLAISNCRNRCVGCHSAELRKDIGTELTEAVIDRLISKNNGVSCFLFLGEGNDIDTLVRLSGYVKDTYNIRTAVYSGREDVEQIIWDTFDYVKVGPYKAECGPLNSPTTNQRLYCMAGGKTDITYRFWKNVK